MLCDGERPPHIVPSATATAAQPMVNTYSGAGSLIGSTQGMAAFKRAAHEGKAVSEGGLHPMAHGGVPFSSKAPMA